MTRPVCPDCGRHNTDNRPFCSCGKNLKMEPPRKPTDQLNPVEAVRPEPVRPPRRPTVDANMAGGLSPEETGREGVGRRDSSPLPPPPRRPPAPQPKQPWGLIAIVLAAVVVLGAAATGAYFYLRQSEPKTVAQAKPEPVKPRPDEPVPPRPGPGPRPVERLTPVNPPVAAPNPESERLARQLEEARQRADQEEMRRLEAEHKAELERKERARIELEREAERQRAEKERLDREQRENAERIARDQEADRRRLEQERLKKLEAERAAEEARRRQAAVYSGPRSGVITWQGEVEGDTVVLIEGSTCNRGQMNGSLPGTAVALNLVGRGAAFVSTPSPSNNYRRLSFRISGKGVRTVRIDWTVP